MTYHIKEGATFNPHVYWFDAHLQKGVGQMKHGEYGPAEASFLKAMEFPANLEAERDGKIGIAWYYLGLNSRLANDKAKADAYFLKMVDYTHSQGWGAGDFPELAYFKALASIELGRDKAEADTLFRQLITDGEKRLAPVKDGRHITTSVDESHSARTFLLENELARKDLRVSSYYMQGLGHLGLGDKDKARGFFAKAMELDPLSTDPKRMLEAIGE
jgi:tetratricopeptide (TPR) repeat protein